MSEERLAGSRIRAMRLARGIRQGELARRVGISPAYLNLIEHNRRRIGGKLIVDLARELEVDPSQLAEGAEAALMGALQDAARREPGSGAETDRIEDFAGRFAGWARLVAAQGRRIEALERTAAELSDRLAHDPHLAASLHEVLSTVTAIRSTAAILADTGDIDPDWQARFLRNMGEESRRLAESARGLVSYLDAGADEGARLHAPADDLSAFVEAHRGWFPELEEGGDAEALIATSEELSSEPARALARIILAQYREDARAMPLEQFIARWNAAAQDPGVVAAQFAVPVAAVLRRVAAVSEQAGPAGLVMCDGAGAISFRKQIEGFPLPRFGAGCALWPLYHALARPGQPVEALVEMPGLEPQRFRCLAMAEMDFPRGFSGPPVTRATMLILPSGGLGGTALEVGPTCRICPRKGCPGRREATILGPGSAQGD